MRSRPAPGPAWDVRGAPPRPLSRSPQKVPQGRGIDRTKVRFQRKGGTVDLRLSIALDTASLPPDEASALQDLVKGAGFFDLPRFLTRAGGEAPPYRYKIEVETTTQKHTVVAEGGETPANLLPLLQHLTDLARRRFLARRRSNRRGKD